MYHILYHITKICVYNCVCIYIYRYIHIIWTCHTDTEYIVVCSYVQYLYIYIYTFIQAITHTNTYYTVQAHYEFIYIYIDLHILECVYNVYIYICITSNYKPIEYSFFIWCFWKSVRFWLSGANCQKVCTLNGFEPWQSALVFGALKEWA